MVRFKLFVAIFSVSFCFCSFGQTQQDYDFINAIIPQLKTPGWLIVKKETYPCDLVSDIQFKLYFEELHDKIDSLTFRQMFENRGEISALEARWNQVYLNKKINLVINVQQVDSLQKANKENINVRPFCVMSLPAFNDEKNYGAIDFGSGTALNKLSGTHYLFKKKKGKWVLIATFGAWAS